MALLDEARRLDHLGYNPLPTRRGFKSPGIPKWSEFQKKRSSRHIEAWFGPGSSYVGIWVVCGIISSFLVLDIDSAAAEAWWRAQPGMAAWMDRTTCVRTSKGYHYWGAIEPNLIVKSWAIKDGDVCFDVKAEGGGVMAPPSPHPDGGFYEWVRGPEGILAAPAILLDGGLAVRAALASGEQITASSGLPGVPVGPTSATHSMLSTLLKQTPDEGGRNNWLIKVAGHLARIIPYEDAYYTLVEMANVKLGEPLDLEEWNKVAASAWKAEKAKGLDTTAVLLEQGIVAGEPASENGWLLGTGHALLIPALVGEDKNKNEVLVEWGNFDIKVLGSIISDDCTDYLVEVISPYQTQVCRLDSKILGSYRDLNVWMAKKQCSIVPHPGDRHPKLAINIRLQRYIESQKAPAYKSVDALGWIDEIGGFITHEGIIRAGASEIAPFGDVRPASILGDWAPYHYGFSGDRETARRVLSEVLTFHDRDVTAIYGAWWAACYLKVQIMAETSLYPFMALAAPSESGKTTGFFALMMQLAGNKGGHGEFTMASLRDSVSAHRNSAVWIDDMSEPETIWDLVRQSTSEGGRTKKSQDRYHSEHVRLVAPIVVSAEGLGALSTEKALADRAIRLSVPSPTSRRSAKDPKRLQWDDIRDLQAQYQNDLTQLAGWYVSMALECLPMVAKLRELRTVEGRHGDKLAILRLGARVLAYMSGDDSVIERVDAWCIGTEYMKGDNLLTTEVLPWLLTDNRFPRSADKGHAAFVNPEGLVMYHEILVATKWSERRDLTPRQRQLGSLESIRGQRRDLDIDSATKRLRVNQENTKQMSYFTLSHSLSQVVIQRSGYDMAVQVPPAQGIAQPIFSSPND